jgi:hypothetical protein
VKNSTANQRIAQLKLDLLENKPVEVSFDGEDISGNGGILLAGQAERLTGLLRGAAARLDDHRTQSMIKHNQFEEIAQRVFQIIAGFAACDDSDVLRNDPAIKTAVGRDPLSGEPLASQPTQSRFENNRSYRELYRLCQWLVDYYIQCHRKPPKQLFLDFDGSAIETFGMQLNAFYRGGPYKKYMYFPLFVFDQNGWLLVAALRPGDEGEVELALPVLKKLVTRLRKAWPRTRITVRADGAFTNKELYKWLDDNNVEYVLGIKHNNALLAKSKQFRQEAERKFKRKLEEPQFKGKAGKKRKLEHMKKLRSIEKREARIEASDEYRSRRVRVYGDFMYQAGSWDRERRVIARCDYTDEGIDVRYVVTNVRGYLAHQVYEDIYCQRALAELWIKNLKETQCDRLSCSQFKANMFRLLLHAMAYLLIHQVRIRLSATRMSIEQFRRHFIHVAVQVRESKNRVQIRVSYSYHAAKAFRLAAKRLGACSLIAA